MALFLLWAQLRYRRTEAADRRVAQAQLVSAWLDRVVPPSEPAVDYAPYTIVVFVRNGSAEPVYNVNMKLDVGVRGSFLRRPGALGPGEMREFAIIAPGYPRGIPRPEISFVDSAGQKWLRLGEGQLKAPTQGQLDAFLRESPGAYTSIEAHPTLNLGWTPEANHGKSLSKP